MQRWRGAWLALALVPLLLAACTTATISGGSGSPSATSGGSATPSASAGGGQMKLSCTLATSIEGVDVIKQVLTCTVTGAPASETGMTLSYSATDGSGQTRLLAPACVGTLGHGTGDCTQTYATPAPIGSGPGSVFGHTEPSNLTLGPVIPTQIPGTPGSPGLPGGTTPVAP